jgi:hypothetical protein
MKAEELDLLPRRRNWFVAPRHEMKFVAPIPTNQTFRYCDLCAPGRFFAGSTEYRRNVQTSDVPWDLNRFHVSLAITPDIVPVQNGRRSREERTPCPACGPIICHPWQGSTPQRRRR